MKKILLVVLAFIIVASVLWFLSYKLPELRNGKKPENQTEIRKEVQKERKDWKEKLSWPSECDLNEKRDFSLESGIFEYKLSERESIVLLKCSLGTYQDNYRVYYFDEKNNQAKSLEFETFSKRESGELEKKLVSGFGSVETYQNFKENGKVFHIVEKQSGHMGCGYMGKYEWDDSLKKYGLKEMKGHFDCENPKPYDDWKSIL